MIKSKLVTFFSFLVITLLSFSAFAKDNSSNMTPPKPLENATLNSMVGNWQGEGNMFGMKMRDNVKIYWSLNHQFIMMELHSQGVDNPNIRYDGLGIFGADEKGNVKSWWFDNWGANSVATGTGSTHRNKLVIQDSNAMFKETRSFVIEDSEMKMHAKGTMTMNGKETPFSQTVVYKKQ